MASLSGTTDARNHLTPDFLFYKEKQRPFGFDHCLWISVASELKWRWCSEGRMFMANHLFV